MLRKKMKTILPILMLSLSMVLFVSGCGKADTSEETPKASIGTEEGTSPSSDVDHPRVQIEMKDGGKMVLELYPEYAPETVENFMSLVKSGFYDGLTFHRVVKGFMIQGGDPEGTGGGGSDKTIKGEFASNGFDKNTLSHTRGMISMARSGLPNSASSQFFIVHEDAVSLDGDYAAFGKLVEGEDTLDQIAKVSVKPDMRGEQSIPIKKVVIKTITLLKEK